MHQVRPGRGCLSRTNNVQASVVQLQQRAHEFRAALVQRSMRDSMCATVKLGIFKSKSSEVSSAGAVMVGVPPAIASPEDKGRWSFIRFQHAEASRGIRGKRDQRCSA